MGWIARLGLIGLLLALMLRPELFSAIFAPFAPERGPVFYDRVPLWSLALSQLILVAVASGAASIIAITLAVLVTRPFGQSFAPLSRSLANFGQTFPPVAVLALAVPALGFGTWPTLVALFLYGLLPVFENTLTGLTTLPPRTMEAARGMGLTNTQRLWQVELPLALPFILAGMRLTIVISLGTATIGSTVAAATLGEVIIAGLLTNNTAFVLQGGLITGLFAVLIYDLLILAETAIADRMGRPTAQRSQ